MTQPTDPTAAPARPATPNQQDRERQARAERVAGALRANLLKRKQQARARAEPEAPPVRTDDV